MTKPLSSLTPEQAERQRAQTKAYRERTASHRKAQEAARHKSKYANDPEYRARKNRSANLCRMRKRYGLTPEDRQAMIEAQNGRCAICGTLEPGGRGWHIDHCHRQGHVRELLCTSCNVFVGRIEKKPDLLAKALAYIERHKK